MRGALAVLRRARRDRARRLGGFAGRRPEGWRDPRRFLGAPTHQRPGRYSQHLCTHALRAPDAEASALHALHLKQQQRLTLNGGLLVADREAEDAALFISLFVAFKAGHNNDIPRSCA